jgi:signal transduction histidine kinase
LALLALSALGLNTVLAVSAMSLYDSLPVRAAIQSFGAPFPGLAANAVLFACVAPLYDQVGTVGLASALVLVLLGTYFSHLALSGQVRDQRIGQLAADRADLLRDIVRVESLERRRLADRVHDGPLQSAFTFLPPTVSVPPLATFWPRQYGGVSVRPGR